MIEYYGPNHIEVNEVLDLVRGRRLLRGNASPFQNKHIIVDSCPEIPSESYMDIRENWYAGYDVDHSEIDSVMDDNVFYKDLIDSLPSPVCNRYGDWLLNDLYEIARARAQGEHRPELESMFEIYSAGCFPVGWQEIEDGGVFEIADASVINKS